MTKNISKKEAYKLCWLCNKRFQGNHKYEYQTPDGHEVYVHDTCKEAEKRVKRKEEQDRLNMIERDKWESKWRGV